MSTTEREALGAGTVWWDGELFTGGPDWTKLLSAKAPALTDGGAGLPRRPVRGALPHARRLADHARARRPAAEVCDFIKKNELLGDDHPEGVRRARLLRATRTRCRRREAVDRSQRPSPRRPSACRTRSARPSCCCTTAPTSRSSTACRASRRGDEIPCFALTGAACRLGRDVDSATTASSARGSTSGSEDRRHPAQLRQALHHARADRDRHRPRVPACSTPEHLIGDDRRLRHHGRAGAARDCQASTIGRRHFPLNIPFQNGPSSRARTCSCRSTRSSAGRRWRARAGACWSSSSSVGRCISLPSQRDSAARRPACTRPARYARIRRQFNLPIGKLRRRRAKRSRAWPARTYTIMDAARAR